MIVTDVDAKSGIEDLLAMYISDRLGDIELRMRADMAATGPARDLPHDPASPWRRIEVDEAVQIVRDEFESWRDALIELFNRHP